MLNLELKFALVVSSGGGLAVWSPSTDVQVLEVECNAAIVLSLSSGVVYPSGVVDGLLFGCSQAGKFDTAFSLKGGANLFSVRSGLGAYTIGLAYQVLTANPEPGQ